MAAKLQDLKLFIWLFWLLCYSYYFNILSVIMMHAKLFQLNLYNTCFQLAYHSSFQRSSFISAQHTHVCLLKFNKGFSSFSHLSPACEYYLTELYKCIRTPLYHQNIYLAIHSILSKTTTLTPRVLICINVKRASWSRK